ncbi:hypothetical protein [Streptomyces sp. NPDC058268]|uniref:hypothetical protein n=1 Tax=Streptomyces sp. NPDC058268 TaxID=3346413 RepID=UPI0036ECDB51
MAFFGDGGSFAEAGARRELRPHLGKLFADEGLVTRQLVDDLLKHKCLDGVCGRVPPWGGGAGLGADGP